ncbi:hypothetical protein ACIQM4_00795 [Streptomyces sp. NPDC091272]|uniref:hypothetical protein n=1 Tax=Streptomyces sp. NPDC091272 TaxID=3365981 RepID=UPI0038030131
MLGSHSFAPPTAASHRFDGRSLVIEEFDKSDHGIALLSICVVATPDTTAFAGPLRNEG